MEQSETVAVSDLQVRYGSLLALSIKSLMIHASSGVIGLFGPNGAGKSTFLRTVSGDIGRFAGRISKPPRHRVAYLPDEPFLYRWMKVAQCAQLFASRHDDFRPAVFERFLEGSKITANKRVSSLSKGMSERIHLALIMSRTPDLYVLDEPLGGVDPVVRDHLLDLIRDLRSENVPLLLSTHLINGVDKIFDNIILISDGFLLTHDSAENLRRLGDGDLELAYKRSVMMSHE